ncbi:glycoside hydrolase family 13 protein [Clostridium tertium]|uniref:glycoside hydrolase family 13 protein n=1 Tax=Clostridium tertium TaxID=1559 RepID=UPI00241EB960|nr:glycoside hydrolase family 13 protein [Clostridium tertium]
MNKFAVYHITDVPYAYAKNTNTLTIRIRTAKNDLNSCYIYYEDRFGNYPFIKKEMSLISEGEFYSYYEADLSVSKNRYKYIFELIDKDNNIYILDERGFRKSIYECVDANSFQFPYISPDDVYDEVKTLQESIVYQIFPDRFCKGLNINNPNTTASWGDENINSKSVLGGNLQGIIDKLDYIESLGINLLYLTPIFKSSSNHKYNTCNYYEIDEAFGDTVIAKSLIDKCHEKGIKVIFDAVFNHSGDDFFAFQDVIKNGENSKYKDWYIINSFPIDQEKINYYTFANNIREMPKLNTSNEEVQDYFINVGKYWINEIGIDGWRLDVSDEVSHNFWKNFRKGIKSLNKDLIIIGEIFHNGFNFLRGDEFDCIMNYTFKNACVDFFAKGIIDSEDFLNILSENRMLYMNSISRQMWNLLGSHDTKRFINECQFDISSMKLALVFQFSYIGVPYIYYGDEIGLTGEDDPLNRKCMIWDTSKQNNDLLDLYKLLINLRKKYKSLIYGTFTPIYYKNNLLIFKRELPNESILICLNKNTKDIDAKLNFDINGFDLINKSLININKHNSINFKSMEYKIIKLQ